MRLTVLKVETSQAWSGSLSASGEAEAAGERRRFYTDDPMVAARLVAAKSGDTVEVEAVRDLEDDLILVGKAA